MPHTKQRVVYQDLDLDCRIQRFQRLGVQLLGEGDVSVLCVRRFDDVSAFPPVLPFLDLEHVDRDVQRQQEFGIASSILCR